MTMPTPAPVPQLPPLARQPYFKGALFWYVAWRVALTTAIAGGTFAYFFLSAILYPEEVDALLAYAEDWDRAANGITILVSIVLCIVVAGRHELSFGRGVLLFVAGNFISNAICLPFYVLAMAGDDDNVPPGWVWAYAATVGIYAVGCGIAMYYRRRRMLTVKRQRDVVSVFD
jgi:hypothetical protein